MKRTLAVLVRNQSGVLSRVAGLFSRRGFNIDSLAVGTTDDPEISRMTIVVDADESGVEQITKQLHKLIDVLKITDITQEDMVDRELALIKVNAEPATRSDILQVADIFRARVVDVGENSLIVEVTGDEGKVDAMIQLLRPHGIKEIVRTGMIAMVRGSKPRQPAFLQAVGN